MAKAPMTEERRQKLRDQLARARERKQEKAAAAQAEDDALLQAPIEQLDEPAVEIDARRARLLEGIPSEIASLISDAELDQIEREEQARAEDERKKKALAAVREQMRQRARVEHDLISSDTLRTEAERQRLREPDRFRVLLPNNGAGHRGDHGFRVDGRLFQQGMVYTEPRAVFESLQANHYRAWLDEYRFSTLNQTQPGMSAPERLGEVIPRFEVIG